MYSKTVIIFGVIICILGLLMIWIVYYFWKVRNRSDLDYHTSAELSQHVEEKRREHLRADINWPVSMETSNGKIEAEARNISFGGAFICCDHPLPIGTVFGLIMMGPNKEPVTATAKVVWSNVNVPAEKVINRGMGVRFISMSDQHIKLMRQLFQ